ncbi:MAG: ABC transporter permease, partial [Planctomycetota bacterium]
VLARRAVGRNANRSILTIGLLSVASFLIASMSVFQISPTEKGYGGFNLIAQSSQPIYRDLSSGKVRSERLGDKSETLLDCTILPMRAKIGDDASCNNLFQVSNPTILGLPPTLSEIHDFAPGSVEFEWAASKVDNPWSALAERGNGSEYDPYPVILDQNTAMWSLKQGASIGSIIKLTINNRVVHFETVGLLSNSVLQGKLIVSQRHFEAIYPNVSGYSFFLINSGESEAAETVTEVLESGWGDEGLDVQFSQEVLAKYLGVQNTYIMAFQSLGALGLLLGTFGLVAVQIRSVLERKKEFALMRAVGFSPSRLSKILVVETGILLGGGLLIGLVCALVALVPYVLEVGPQISIISPILMLMLVIAAGFVASLLAIRAANAQQVLEGLRSE